MTDSPEARLAALGLSLPEVPIPVANYIPAVRSGNRLYIAGQVPFQNGKLMVAGKVGDTVTEEDGIYAARLCALNVLAQAKAVLGDLARITRVLKLNVFVAAPPSFTRHPFVANGASDLMVAAFGEAGRHARSAVGCTALPLDAAVEVDAVFEVA